MATIKIMDEILANKIAAGEVVERCSSVVKELVENSIDAKSTVIKIELIDSGIKEIKVTDNGIGMNKEDAMLAFYRHATSKIIEEEDLYHIHTLGFRGEALASIASVSNIELITSTGDIGTSINIRGGKIINTSTSDGRKGTSISVKDLFYNTPARLKHLKSLYAELASITEYINKLALSKPNIRFSLYNNNKQLLNTDGKNNLLKTISTVFGVSVARKMIEINGNNNDYEVCGYISLPEIHRSTRNSIITFVNNRIVKNNSLNKTINEAYHSYKPDNYYPIVILNIYVDTTLTDVNIHPTKMDIKFGKMEQLLDLINDLIKNALKPKTLIPHIDSLPKIGNIKEEDIYNKDIIQQKSPINIVNQKLDFLNDIEEKYTINESLFEEIHEDVKQKLPIIYPVGLVHGTYIICQNEDSMYIIDQHAAKERINYEYCLDKLCKKDNKKLDMLVPLTIELTNSEFIIIKENLQFLSELGFNIEEFGINSIIIKSHPIWIKENENEAIRKIIDIIINEEKKFDVLKFNDKVAATMACKMSIKANTNITMDEMNSLINDLRKCNNPFNCPHGRPTVIYYSKTDLEKMFKRSGF